MKRRSLRHVIGMAILGLFFLSACSIGAASDTVYTVVSKGELSPGASIPVPQGDVVVTVSGKIGTTNVGDTIQMDMATIESVGLVDYTVTDPFEGDERTFRGVLMSTLLDLWQVADDATTLRMVALNDYTVEVPIGDLHEYPVIFAIMENGEYMPVSTRGPAMLVYPYDDFDFDPAIYNNYWIWQIKAVEVQ